MPLPPLPPSILSKLLYLARKYQARFVRLFFETVFQTFIRMTQRQKHKHTRLLSNNYTGEKKVASLFGCWFRTENDRVDFSNLI